MPALRFAAAGTEWPAADSVVPGTELPDGLIPGDAYDSGILVYGLPPQ